MDGPLNRMTKLSLKAIVLNETGQMSIFVALLFQVLFVFFAMVVNIGMLVHDKINLQNAVDLAAYYGAQRQAEILNEIAHLNYQIRQDYKLLAWRYHVLGTLGRSGIYTNAPPPAVTPSVGNLSEKKYEPPYSSANDRTPVLCVNNQLWGDFIGLSTEQENYCFKEYNKAIPQIPSVVVIAPFVPLVGVSQGFTEQAKEQREIACAEAGPRNWAFAVQTLYAYKQAVAARKAIVWALRSNLVSGDFKDQQNNSVKAGVLKTLKKNLSKANEGSFQEDNFEMLNGMSLGQCAQGNGGFAMPEVLTAPVLLYVHNENGCMPEVALHTDTSKLGSYLSKWDPNGQMQSLSSGEPDPSSPFASTLGFEKNPWCMAYIGVKAKTQPYKPFAPFGSAVEIEARGFAQPFGGRVGPWYRERWTRGADKSGGGERIDPLTTPRLLGTNTDTSGGDNKEAPLPNYSRFPGDKLGLTSEVTLGAQNKIFNEYKNKAPAERLKLAWFSKFDDIPKTGDPLATDGGNDPFGGVAGPLRRAEVSAVAPDLFDATYYSVDPKFFLNYASLGADRFLGAGGGGSTKPIEFPDIGGRIEGGGDVGKYSVEHQITDSLEKGFDDRVLEKLPYVLRDWQHLLTAWAPNKATNFDFPAERFAQCADSAKDDNMIPGKCVAGGRVGYSVRVISRSALFFNAWKIGGDGEGEGAILNPPGEEF